MIRESLDAFVREDTELALKVCKDDHEVDQLNSQIFPRNHQVHDRGSAQPSTGR